MSEEKFKLLIESIGFKHNVRLHKYKEYRIDLFFIDHYNFFNGSEWFVYEYNNLTPIEVHFKKELRSIKLKNILG